MEEFDRIGCILGILISATLLLRNILRMQQVQQQPCFH